MPTKNNGDVVPHTLAHTIIWKMAAMMNQAYWRVSVKPVTKFGDVEVDMTDLINILNEIENNNN